MKSSLEQRMERKSDRSGGPDNCWLWRAGKTRKGYGQIYDAGKDRRAHRVAWEITHGAIPTGLHVLHRCDNRACVNPRHLFLGTNADNVADKVAKGRAPRGTESVSPLAAEEVLAIRADARSHRTIAADYGIHPTTVHYIKTRATWGHLTERSGVRI